LEFKAEVNGARTIPLCRNKRFASKEVRISLRVSRGQIRQWDEASVLSSTGFFNVTQTSKDRTMRRPKMHKMQKGIIKPLDF
jgi:hypothetical protein